VAFKSQAELDEALRVGTVAPEDMIVEEIVIAPFPATEAEVKAAFENFAGADMVSEPVPVKGKGKK
jgi:hypothetical protein